MVELTAKTKLCSCCGFCIIVTVTFLIAYCWRVLDYNELGLRYNNISKKVDEKAYQPGRHYIGVGYNFHRYKRTVHTVSFSNGGSNKFQVQSGDAKSLTIELSFSYRLDPKNLYNVYKTYKWAYEASYIRNCRAKLRDVASQYTGRQYVLDAHRVDIEATMKAAIRSELAAEFEGTNSTTFKKGGAELEAFQIFGISFVSAAGSQSLDDQLLYQQQMIMDQRLLEQQRITSNITKYTEYLLEEMVREKVSDLSVYSSLTSELSAEVAGNAIQKRQETNRLVQAINDNVARNLTKYRADTTAQSVEESEEVVRVETQTGRDVQVISSSVDILRAEKSSSKQMIDASALAYATVEADKATAYATIIQSTALREAFGNWTIQLGFTPSNINDLEFKNALDAHHKSKMFIDIQKPSVFNLAGQSEILDETLHT